MIPFKLHHSITALQKFSLAWISVTFCNFCWNTLIFSSLLLFVTNASNVCEKFQSSKETFGFFEGGVGGGGGAAKRK